MGEKQMLIDQLREFASLLDAETKNVLNKQKEIKISSLLSENQRNLNMQGQLERKLNDIESNYKLEIQQPDETLTEYINLQVDNCKFGLESINSERDGLSYEQASANDIIRISDNTIAEKQARQQSIENLRNIDAELASQFDQEYENNAALIASCESAKEEAQANLDNIALRLEELNQREVEYQESIDTFTEALDGMQESVATEELDLEAIKRDTLELARITRSNDIFYQEWRLLTTDIFDIDSLISRYENDEIDEEYITDIITMFKELNTVDKKLVYNEDEKLVYKDVTYADKLNEQASSLQAEIAYLTNKTKNSDNYLINREYAEEKMDEIKRKLEQNEAAYRSLTTYGGSREEMKRISNEYDELNSDLDKWQNIVLPELDKGNPVKDGRLREPDLALLETKQKELKTIQDKISNINRLTTLTDQILNNDYDNSYFEPTTIITEDLPTYDDSERQDLYSRLAGDLNFVAQQRQDSSEQTPDFEEFYQPDNFERFLNTGERDFTNDQNNSFEQFEDNPSIIPVDIDAIKNNPSGINLDESDFALPRIEFSDTSDEYTPIINENGRFNSDFSSESDETFEDDFDDFEPVFSSDRQQRKFNPHSSNRQFSLGQFDEDFEGLNSSDEEYTPFPEEEEYVPPVIIPMEDEDESSLSPRLQEIFESGDSNVLGNQTFYFNDDDYGEDFEDEATNTSASGQNDIPEELASIIGDKISAALNNYNNQNTPVSTESSDDYDDTDEYGVESETFEETENDYKEENDETLDEEEYTVEAVTDSSEIENKEQVSHGFLNWLKSLNPFRKNNDNDNSRGGK